MSKTAIEWATDVWNPLTGCTRVSAGCDNCYAARQAATRLRDTDAYRDLAVVTPSGRAAFNGRIRLLPERLDQPLRWRKPRRVFVNSMSDLFHPDVPDEYIAKVFTVMAAAERHTFQVLTKRPERMAALLADPGWCEQVKRMAWSLPERDKHCVWYWPLPNVWLGTSVEDKPAADERIPHLLRTPAAVRFLSCEPLIGALALRTYLWKNLRLSGRTRTHHGRRQIGFAHDGLRGDLHWVIVGGESGPGARPMDVAWVRSIMRQCREAGVAVFVKQMGAHVVDQELHVAYHCPREECWPDGEDTDIEGDRVLLRDKKGGDQSEWPEDLRVREMPDDGAAAPEVA